MSSSTPRERDLVSRVKLQWHRDGRPDAVNFLSENLGIRQNRSLALELAYEEYCIRRDQGEQLEAVAFCRRFPTISRSLYRQIEVEEYVRSNPDILSSQSTVAWPRLGDALFDFTVVEEIGRGAFARAYLCAQAGVGNRQVVVKVSHGGAIEADTMGGLNHPNIMSVHSVQTHPDSALTGICMPFVGRSTLYDVIDVAFGGGKIPVRASVLLEASRAMMRRGDRYQQMRSVLPFSAQADYVVGVLHLGIQIADALAHAHQQGVLHGDLKPSNIVMSVGGTPMIVDFNLSQCRDSTNLMTGGTLPYMAPEQIRALLLGADHQDQVDQRSDIFSLGAILYELLTGRAASGEQQPDVEPFILAGRMLDKHQKGIERVNEFNTKVSKGLSDFIARCLAYEPDQRPDSMQAVAHALQKQLSTEKSWQRALLRNRRVAAGVIVAVGTLAAATAIWASHRPPLRDRAFTAALAAYEEADNKAAIESLNLAIREDQHFGVAYLARGCAELREYENENFKGWLDSAFDDLSLATRYSNGPDALRARAYCVLKRGQFDLALNEYRDMVQKGHTGTDVLNNMAYCILQSSMFEDNAVQDLPKRLDEADRVLTSVIRSDPDVWQAYLNLAILELRRCTFTNEKYLPVRGLDAIRQVVRLNPNDAGTFYIAMRLAGIVGSAQQNEGIIRECVQYANQAADLGHSFSSVLAGSSNVFGPLMGRSDFRQAISRPAAAKAVTAADRAISPECLFSLRLAVDRVSPK